MALTWSSCAILFAVLLGARALPLGDDDLVKKVEAIVNDIDEYLATHGMSELFLPDIGVFPFEPIKLRNGELGDFSTIYVQEGASAVNKTQRGNDTLYRFKIDLGLDELKVYYDFSINGILIREKGNFSLSMLENSAQLIGYAVILNNKVCKAKLESVRVLEAEDYRIDLSVDSSAFVLVSEVILNTITPKLEPLLNTALQAALLVPGVQNIFSAFTCSHL